MFGPEVPQLPPHQRPIYGAINAWNVENGAAPVYGTSHLELKPEVKKRSTVSRVKNDPAGIHHAERPFGLVAGSEQNPDSELWQSLAKAPDDRQVSGEEHANNHNGRYLEAHIHGGIDYGRDVQALHIHPESWGHPETGQRIQASAKEFAQKYNVPVYVQQKRMF
jgi:hypothetical protein